MVTSFAHALLVGEKNFKLLQNLVTSTLSSKRSTLIECREAVKLPEIEFGRFAT